MKNQNELDDAHGSNRDALLLKELQPLCSFAAFDYGAVLRPGLKADEMALRRMLHAYCQAAIIRAAPSDRDLPAVVRRALASEGIQHPMWRAELGAAMQLARLGSWAPACAQLLLMLATDIVPGESSHVHLPTPAFLLVANTWQHVCCDVEVVCSDRGRYAILDGRDRIDLIADHRNEPGLVVCSEMGARTVWPDSQKSFESHPKPADVREQLSAAFDVIRKAAPVYLNWVTSMVTSVLPISFVGRGGFSGSHIERPGMVAASFPMHPVLLGEAMVHEASHQHYYLGAAFVDYCDMAAPFRFYSSIRQRPRPAWAVVLAYHAVCNIALYYLELLRHRHDPQNLSSQRWAYWDLIAKQYEELTDTISITLTDTGRLIWECLRKEMGISRQSVPI